MHLRLQAWAQMGRKQSSQSARSLLLYSAIGQPLEVLPSPWDPCTCDLSPFLQIRPSCPFVKLAVWTCSSWPIVPGRSSQEPFCVKPRASSASEGSLAPSGLLQRLSGWSEYYLCFFLWKRLGGEPWATLWRSLFRLSHQQHSLPHMLPDHSAPHANHRLLSRNEALAECCCGLDYVPPNLCQSLNPQYSEGDIFGFLFYFCWSLFTMLY